MNIKHFLVYILLLIGFSSQAQKGGDDAYAFLNMKYSARIASLGNTFLPLSDNKDVSLIATNPANLSPSLDNSINFNFVNFFGGANYGSLSYAKTFNKIGNFGATLQYLNYGKMKEVDEYENFSGTFLASDYALVLGWGRNLDSNFSIGANLKPVLSQYETYTAFALGVDVSGMYQKGNFSAVLLAKNIGTQLVTLADTRESLPFEIQAGLSYKLPQAPFRLFFMLNNLQKWDVDFTDPLDTKNQENLLDENPKEPSKFSEFMDMSMRHVVIGTELSIAKCFFLRLGYNYRMQQEMKVPSKTGFVGFSWGAGLRVRTFEINYARQTYNLAGSPNFISISTNLNHFL